MTKISLHIEAESPYDLLTTLREMLPTAEQMAGVGDDSDSDDDTAEAKPKRTRRSKKKDPEPAEAEKGDSDGGSADSEPSTPEPQPEPEKVEEKKAAALDDVKTAMQAVVDANAVEALIELMKEIGAVDGDGNPKVSALAAAKYDEAIEKMTALAAKHSVGATGKGVFE